MGDAGAPPTSLRCAQCRAEIAASLLSCPSCHALVHAEALKQLAAEASRAGETGAALEVWRRALDLLPADSTQAEVVRGRIGALSAAVDAGKIPAAPVPSPAKTGMRRSGVVAAVGGVGLLLFKFKWLVIFALTKLKFLFLGLTKMSTLFSMLLSLGVYWKLWGWKFGVGLVGSMYIHEMGHVAMLRRYGVKATAPTFIPGLGAVIRLQQTFLDPREDARVGLAGPLWGLGAALLTCAIYFATKEPFWGAITHTGAWLNLFNLLPLGTLDGGRGFHSLTREQRWGVTAAMGAMWLLTGEGLLVLLLIVAVMRSFGQSEAKAPDHTGFVQFLVLVVTLSLLTLVKVLPGSP